MLLIYFAGIGVPTGTFKSKIDSTSLLIPSLGPSPYLGSSERSLRTT